MKVREGKGREGWLVGWLVVCLFVRLFVCLLLFVCVCECCFVLCLGWKVATETTFVVLVSSLGV